jgi:hypothetical protein
MRVLPGVVAALDPRLIDVTPSGSSSTCVLVPVSNMTGVEYEQCSRGKTISPSPETDRLPHPCRGAEFFANEDIELSQFTVDAAM